MDQGKELQEGTVYRFHETKAPNNYKISTADTVFVYGKTPKDNIKALMNAEETIINDRVVSVNVKKEWNEESDTHSEVSVTLKATTSNGNHPYSLPDGITATQMLNAGNNWTYTWENLPKYDKDDQNNYYEIHYEVEEFPCIRPVITGI